MLERLNSAGIKVTLRRSARANRISISVKRSGEVTLTLPANFDKDKALQMLESKSDWIIKTVARQKAKPQQEEYSIEELNRLIREANSYLPERIEHISKRVGLPFNNLTISRARTRWGSCSTRNDISLSFHLMRLPRHLIDFVIIHELCHTKHHNHSAEFHALVDRITGGHEAELIRELKGYR